MGMQGLQHIDAGHEKQTESHVQRQQRICDQLDEYKRIPAMSGKLLQCPSSPHGIEGKEWGNVEAVPPEAAGNTEQRQRRFRRVLRHVLGHALLPMGSLATVH
jgi:hypothetical protein